MSRFRQLFTLLLLPVDYLMVLAAFVLAYQLKIEFPLAPIIYLQPLGEYLHYAIYFSAIWIGVFFVSGLYRFRGFRNHWQLLARVIAASTMALAVFIMLLFLTKTYFFSRLTIIYFWPVSILMVMAGRGVLESIKNWFQTYGTGVERVLLIGEGEAVGQLEQHLGDLFPAVKVADVQPRIDFANLEDRKDIAKVIVCYEPQPEEMVRLIRWCEDHGVAFQYIPSLVGVYAARMSVDSVKGYPLIELEPTSLAGWGRVGKRLFDLAAGTIGLVLASPIMLATAIAIRLDSKGPILFKQTRIGELGRPFTFYKFRSMYTELSTGEGYGGKEAEQLLEKLRQEGNEADGPMFKMTHDPRVTRVGRFIRKTSLDELPQFFNILKGEMSLVGPRPALPNEVEQYDDAARRRLLVKPGVTGMWQVSGRNDVPFDEYVRLDTYYIENWSLWLDLKIILLTVRAVLARTGK